jgi:hypothetical protein
MEIRSSPLRFQIEYPYQQETKKPATMKKIRTITLLTIAQLVVALPMALAQQGEGGNWQSLFNGKDLTGWRELNGKHIWEVQDGMIVGRTVPGQPNGFLCTDEEFGDFVLELEVSVDTLMNNSGIQFRSQSYEAYKNGRVHGYQMEVDPKPQQWSGAIYEEGAERGWIYPPEKMTPEAKNAFVRDDKDGYRWNHYRIEAVGAVMRTWINGVPVAHLVDDRYPAGFIGLQLHANNEHDPQGSFSIRFRNIRIQQGSLTLTPLNDKVPMVNLLKNPEAPARPSIPHSLRIEANNPDGRVAVFPSGKEGPILTHVAKVEERPYIHPLIAPDGNGEMTEYRPAHHPHQTGIYWGLKRVNERDYFMQWNKDYWRRVYVEVIEHQGDAVQWQTTYEMLGDDGQPLLVETQTWTMQQFDDRYILDLEWRGDAKEDVVMGKFYVGGLFVRMPWDKHTEGEIVGAAGQRGVQLEGQRAIWADIGMKLQGRGNYAHIAILDHPANPAFPTPWRVDNEMGIGPSRQILGDWKIPAGASETFRFRLLVYTGDLDKDLVTEAWQSFFSGE